MKLRPVGAELFHADRRTDLTKLIVASRNFANASKKECEFLDYSKSKDVHLCVGVKG